MLLFRLFAPFFWYWVVRVLPDVMLAQNEVRPAPTRLRAIAVGSGLATVAAYLLLQAITPFAYEAPSLFRYYIVVDWLPLLAVPTGLWVFAQHRRPAVLPIATAVQMQFAAVLGVLWLEALVHSGVWVPYALFVRPLVAMVLSVVPVVAFRWAEKALYGRKRHLVWFVPVFAAAAGAGIQLLFRVQRVVWGSGLAAGCVVLVAVFLYSYARYAQSMVPQSDRDV